MQTDKDEETGTTLKDSVSKGPEIKSFNTLIHQQTNEGNKDFCRCLTGRGLAPEVYKIWAVLADLDVADNWTVDIFQ